MCEENLWALWFQSVPGIGRKTIYRLEETFGSLNQAAAASEEELRRVMKPAQINSLREFSQTPDGLARQCERAGVRYVTASAHGADGPLSGCAVANGDISVCADTSECVSGDNQEGRLYFPERLRQIPDPPYGLFVKGILPDPDRPAVAIIGARACSAYGREAARLMGSAAAAAGIQVISGMARGIDSISQKACLDAGGKSCAVLGSGVDICYPPEERPLYERLSSEGGIISEYPLGTQPLNKNFPPRNRLISGLADLVLVIEAREKSGTLITVDMALEQGREVAVVPGRITDALSQGCHKLYSQGAHLVISPQQMADLVWEAFALRQEAADRSPGRKAAADMAERENERKPGGEADGGTDRVLAGNEYLSTAFSMLKGELSGFRRQEGNHLYDPSLSPYLNQLLALLDTTPQSVEELYRTFQENDGHESLPAFLTGLLELELAGKCINVGEMYASGWVD